MLIDQDKTGPLRWSAEQFVHTFVPTKMHTGLPLGLGAAATDSVQVLQEIVGSYA